MKTAKLFSILKTSFFVVGLGIILNLKTPMAYALGPQDWVDRPGINCTGTGAFVNDGGAITTDAHDVATIQGFGCLLANILSVTITLIGLAAFVMFIVASFRLLAMPGNSKSKELAKGTITYAIIGLVLALSAFIILNLIGQFTGVDVTNFIIPEAGTDLGS